MKDKSTRSEYDAKYKTQQYIAALDEVTNEVVKPFATDIAIPFLNYTFQSLKDFAIPFIERSIETSAVVLEEVKKDANAA